MAIFKWTWRLLKLTKTLILVLLLCFSISLNISAFIGGAMFTAASTVFNSVTGSKVLLNRKAAQLAIQKTRLQKAVAQARLDERAKARVEKNKTIAKTKAKARIRRAVIAVPLVGIAAATWFEKTDFDEWQVDNPGKNKNDYLCEISTISAEIVDEVLQELPSELRPGEGAAVAQLPRCEE